MSDAAKEAPETLELEYDLDATPEKVWRAVRVAEFRERWLPNEALVDARPISSVPGEEVRYRMRNDAPPFLESTVTFQIMPNTDGGTRLRIIHRLTDARSERRLRMSANDNSSCLMLAA